MLDPVVKIGSVLGTDLVFVTGCLSGVVLGLVVGNRHGSWLGSGSVGQLGLDSGPLCWPDH